jgi:hypothetical protein
LAGLERDCERDEIDTTVAFFEPILAFLEAIPSS